MCNKRNPSEEEITAQYNALVNYLAKIGLKPEDVPQALEELQLQIRNELAIVQKVYNKLASAVS